MANIRTERINAELMKAISVIVANMNDPRLSTLVTISDVVTTADLSYAKVKVGVLSESDVQKEIISVLTKSKGHIRHELAAIVRLRKIPDLIFELDAGFAHSTRINEILKNLNLPQSEE